MKTHVTISQLQQILVFCHIPFRVLNSKKITDTVIPPTFQSFKEVITILKCSVILRHVFMLLLQMCSHKQLRVYFFNMK